MNSEDDIKAYVRERNEILLACDVDRLIAFMQKHVPYAIPSSRESAEVTLHKTRTAATGLPMEARILSKRWLLERGYRSMDGGEVNL